MATPLGTGGTFGLHVKHATVTYADTTAAELFDLPPDSYLVGIEVDVQTAFAGGTTTIDVGTGADGDHYIDGLDVSTTGRKSPTLLEMAESQGERPVTITATAGAGNSQGSCTLLVLYFTLSHSHLH